MKRISQDFTIRPLINRRERDTLLAALRLWQSRKTKLNRSLREHFEDTAKDFGPALSSKEIEDLCDRLNFGTKTKHA